VKIHTLSEIIY